MTPEEKIEFCNYVQPIVNGCSGFIKTSGYMVHMPGVIILMNDDKMFFSVINLPVVYNVYFTSRINTFLSLKDPELQKEFLERTYFISWNMIHDMMMDTYNRFYDIDNKVACIYSEPDCYNINGFTEAVSTSSISSVNVLDGNRFFRVPASKAITPLTKSDSASLRIYDCIYPEYNSTSKTIRYTVYKKKFKLNIDIYSNILIL